MVGISGLLFVALYFVPWFIAIGRKHPDRSAICALNLLLGWTVLGWIAALVWAYTGSAKSQSSKIIIEGPETTVSDIADEIERLVDLKNDGSITEEEFLRLKAKALKG